MREPDDAPRGHTVEYDADVRPVPRDLLARVDALLAPPAEPARAPATPPDKGLVLAEVDRGAEGALVLAWAEYEGKPYLSLRVWRDGWPVKGKGVSIRLRELEPLLRGLLAAEEA